MDRPEWTSRAKAVKAASVDIGFLISDTFYYGPENDFSQEQWQKLREPLYKPAVDCYGNLLLSAELANSPAELIRYYEDVLRSVANHRKKMEQQSPYFWMRPLIFARGEFAITFPYYDSWEEAGPLFDAVTAPEDGELFHDLEQGWEVHAFAEGDQMFMREGDFDSGDEHIVIATNRAQLAGQIPALRERGIRLVQELSAAFGRDYWSRRW